MDALAAAKEKNTASNRSRTGTASHRCNTDAKESQVPMPTPSPSPKSLATATSSSGRFLRSPISEIGTGLEGREALSMERDGKFATDLIRRMESKRSSSETKNDKSGSPDNENDVDVSAEIKEEVISEDDEGGNNEKSTSNLDQEIKEEMLNNEKEEKSEEEEDITDRIYGMVDIDMATTTTNGIPQSCRYCKTEFISPVELHQHERYLCSANHDIKRVMNSASNNLGSPAKKSRNAESRDCNSQIMEDIKRELDIQCDDEFDDEDEEDEDDDEDDEYDEFYDEDESESVSRDSNSPLTEKQLEHLKACYHDNPKPTKQALKDIAQQLGLPRKVVQVRSNYLIILLLLRLFLFTLFLFIYLICHKIEIMTY